MNKHIAIAFLVLVLSGSASAAEPASVPRRIVSLTPSTTEILFAMGLGDRIAGVTNYCDYPDEAKKKPKIGGMSNPSLEAVLTLEPGDLILTGTPAGVGAGHRPPLYLQAGDVVRIEIARLGAIENRFVPDRGETVIL